MSWWKINNTPPHAGRHNQHREIAMKTFIELAKEAAKMENEGNVKEAAIAWRRAGAYCSNQQNREWCSARNQFCESMFALKEA